MVDLMVGRDGGDIRNRLIGSTVEVPAHFDAEVLSALGRLCRAKKLTADEVTAFVPAVSRSPFTRHALTDLLAGAWRRRHELRLVDALYVELAEALQVPLLTTDVRLASAYSRAFLP